MILDSKLAGILSNFCLDIAKAYFITAFVSPPLGLGSTLVIILFLTKGLIAATLFLVLSWRFLELKDRSNKNEYS